MGLWNTDLLLSRLVKIQMLLLMAACLLSGCGTSTDDGVVNTEDRFAGVEAEEPHLESVEDDAGQTESDMAKSVDEQQAEVVDDVTESREETDGPPSPESNEPNEECSATISRTV